MLPTAATCTLPSRFSNEKIWLAVTSCICACAPLPSMMSLMTAVVAREALTAPPSRPFLSACTGQSISSRASPINRGWIDFILHSLHLQTAKEFGEDRKEEHGQYVKILPMESPPPTFPPPAFLTGTQKLPRRTRKTMVQRECIDLYGKRYRVQIVYRRAGFKSKLSFFSISQQQLPIEPQFPK